MFHLAHFMKGWALRLLRWSLRSPLKCQSHPITESIGKLRRGGAGGGAILE